MKISINIQSYGRASNVLALRVAPTASVWVHSFEAGEYAKQNRSTKIKKLPNNARGNLPNIKNMILRHGFGEEKADVVVIMDDDISQLVTFEDNVRVPIPPEQLLEWIGKYSIICREWGFYLWGLNVNQDKQCYREYTPFSTTQYISSSFSCFLKGNQCFYDPQFPLKEDYDMTIQQCERYRGLLRVNRGHYVKLSVKNRGGCAHYRTVTFEREQFDRLQKKWGDQIVQMDDLENSRSHSSQKEKKFDINPVIRVPIAGV